MYSSFTEPFTAADALSWCEYNGARYHYHFPGLMRPPLVVPPGMKQPPLSFFVTSPNANYIPDLIKYDRASVMLRTDGRFFTNDFMIFPQWYFPGTYYLPFIRKKPAAEMLATHPYRVMWYDMKDSDFVHEPGSMVEGYGRLKLEIAEELNAVRKDLWTKLKWFASEGKFEDKELRELSHCRDGMHFASICLLVGPQTLLMTRSTVTLLQRNFFEALACYEYLTIYKPRVHSFESFPVDYSIMGAYTCDMIQVAEFLKMGVPVWYFRHAGTMTKTMQIGSKVYPELPVWSVKDIETASERIFHGPPSAARNRACQALRLQTIRLGHTAYEMLPGDSGQGIIFI